MLWSVFLKCLAKDPYYAPALNKLAALYYRKGQYEKGVKYAQRSLSIDAYDAEGNYIFGLINKALGNYLQSQDGFAVTSLFPSYRKASYIELAKLFLRQNDADNASYYASKAIETDPGDLEANKLMSVISRKLSKPDETLVYIQKIRSVQHLNHYADFEQWLCDGKDESKNNFVERIKWEMPQQTFLDMALWYKDIGDLTIATKLLEIAPVNPLVYLNLAYLYDCLGDFPKSQENLGLAVQEPVDFVFPFRSEETQMLNWALEHSKNWKIKYYLGLLHWSLGNTDSAKKLFSEVGDAPDYPYFYLARASLLSINEDYNPEHDLLKAWDTVIKDWRIFERLIDFYLQNNRTAKALEFAEESLRWFPSNNTLKYVYAKCQMANGEYTKARKALTKTTILPNEGARYGRVTYRQACIMESIDWYNRGKYKKSY